MVYREAGREVHLPGYTGRHIESITPGYTSGLGREYNTRVYLRVGEREATYRVYQEVYIRRLPLGYTTRCV